MFQESPGENLDDTSFDPNRDFEKNESESDPAKATPDPNEGLDKEPTQSGGIEVEEQEVDEEIELKGE